MVILRKEDGQHTVFEHVELGILVAVGTQGLMEIKQFRKAHKGKKVLPGDKVSGFPFIYDIEQASLKIDFMSEQEYEIRYLKKFD